MGPRGQWDRQMTAKLNDAQLKFMGIDAKDDKPWSKAAQSQQAYENWPQRTHEEIYQKGKCVLPNHNPYTLPRNYTAQEKGEPLHGLMEMVGPEVQPENKDKNITKSQQMKNEGEASRMLEKTLSDIKFSFSGREPADIFVYLQEVEIVLESFAHEDLSEEVRIRICTNEMK